MKKFLSVLLSVMMVAGLFVAQVPTSLAATVTNETAALQMPTDTTLIYTEDFEGDNLYQESTPLANHALTEALGWKQAEDVPSTVKDGVTYDAYAQEGLAGTGTATLNYDQATDNHSVQMEMLTQPDGYGWGVQFINDERLAGGDYIVEFTMVIDEVTTSSGWGINLRNNFPWQNKSVSGANSSVLSQDDAIAFNYQIKRNGKWDGHFRLGSQWSANSGVTGSTDQAASWLGAIDGTNHTVESTANGDTMDGNSIIRCENTFRMVVDADLGVHMFVQHNTTGEWMYYYGMDATARAAWAQNSYKLGSGVNFIVRTQVTWSVDDLSVYTYGQEYSDKTPVLLGYQTTWLHNDTHDIRFIAGVKETGATSMGFHVQRSFTQNGTPVSESNDVYCNQLYESIPTDFVCDDLNAAIENYDYFIIFTVTDVSSDLDITYTVTPFAILTENGKTVTEHGEGKTYTVARTLLSETPGFPGGTLASSEEFTSGYWRKFYTGTTQAEYTAYANALSGYGFELYDENTINGNIYKTYTSDWMVLHAYYIASEQTTSIIVTEADNWTPYETEASLGTTVANPTLVMMDMNYLNQTGGQNNGMGLVYTLEDGSYVIIDGGYAAESQALYNYLSANNKREDGQIYIRAWLMSHSDSDHIGCFKQFATDYADVVTLDYFVIQFNANYASTLTALLNKAALFNGCEIITPLPGQIMYFGNLKLEFLYTAEMYYGYTGSDAPEPNQASFVFKAYLENTNVLFMNDALGATLNLLVDYYGSTLKCQYYQAPHHGLNGTTALYDAVRPDYLIMATHAEATAQRLTSTHSHGAQSKLYYLLTLTDEDGNLLINGEDDIFSAGTKDNVAGNEITTIFTVQKIEDPTPTITVSEYNESKDSYTFDELFGG